MGLRGPGAKRQRLAREASGRKRRFPWKAKGLSRAQRVIKFVEWLPVSKGRKLWKRFKLLPSQREFIERVFATDHRGRRKVSLAILSQPKGNGKTGLIACLLLAFLIGPESEERGAVYAASITQKKAAGLFDEMRAIIQRVPEFTARVNIIDFYRRMHVFGEGDGFDSIFESLTSDYRSAQGLAPTVWAYDELGEASDGRLLSVLLESEGKRNETLGLVLSTQADHDDHPLSRLIDDAQSQSSDDPSIYLQLHVAAPDADAFSDETLRACNPASDHFLDFGALQKAANRAQKIPAFESEYRRMRLNQRVAANDDQRLVTASVWKTCDVAVDRAKLTGRPCFGGLDIAIKRDLFSFVLVFPSDEPDPSYDILAYFWTPQDCIAARQPAEQGRFLQWVRSGHLTATPGPIVRFSTVAAEMAQIADEFNIRAIAYDKWRVEFLKIDIADAGVELPLEGFGQGHSRPMATAIEFFSECALTGRLRHGGHPVLTASLVNAIMTPDKAGNPMIDKPKSNSRGPVRVDGAVALVMALGTARGFVAEPPPPSLKGFLANPIMVI